MSEREKMQSERERGTQRRSNLAPPSNFLHLDDYMGEQREREKMRAKTENVTMAERGEKRKLI